MICANCNTRNNYYHNFCYHCGAKLDTVEIPSTADGQMRCTVGVLLNKHRETFNPYRDKKRSRKRWLLSLVVSIIALVGIACWIVLR